jgi:hypothetical protein
LSRNLNNNIEFTLGAGDKDAPLPMDKAPFGGLRRLLLRSINDNQRLILTHVEQSTGRITPFLQELSSIYGIPLSTLKFNAKILKDLNLITYPTASMRNEVEVSKLGQLVLSIIDETSLQEDVQSSELGQLDMEHPGYHYEIVTERWYPGQAHTGGGGGRE